MMAKVDLNYSMSKDLFNPCCVTAQEGLLVRTPGNGKQREPPTKGLAVTTRATSVAENVADEGENSDDINTQ